MSGVRTPFNLPCCHTTNNVISLSMCLVLLLFLSSLGCCSGAGGHNSVTPSTKNTNSSTTTPKLLTPPVLGGCDPNNSTCHNNNNSTNIHTPKYRNLINQIQNNKGMLLRTLYVLIGVTSVVVIYFLIKAVRLRRRRSKSKKYGIITTPASDLEMAPLDQGDDDDEDLTVFEMNGKPK